MHRICLIEDDEIMGEALVQRFALDGFAVNLYRTAVDAAAALATSKFSVVVSDICLPDRCGGELFMELKGKDVHLPPFIFMTGAGKIDSAVELLKAGAVDYITKPFDVDALVEKVRQLAESYGAPGMQESCDLGDSSAMRRIAEDLPRLARHGTPVLITGESGVGKEHVAREIHRLAPVDGGEFVAVNCAAIPESLTEAEFFGYERGAFTGAVKGKRGYIEQANGGTLFLDEIGEMPLSMQTKLLRVLQERKFTRLGGEGPLPSHFHLICATNRDLKSMVKAGSFREDLYYRIDVVQIHIPPLRERREDIRRFVRDFIDEFNRRTPEAPHSIDPRTEQTLLMYDWPGNVRELKNAVERACVRSRKPLLDVGAFFGLEPNREQVSLSLSLSDYMMDCERHFLAQALDLHRGHMTHTAEALGIARKTLWEKLRRLGIKDCNNDSFRSHAA